jgi:hypothetical protein
VIPFGLFNVGNCVTGVIVWTPVPAIANEIVAGTLAAFASCNAARRVHWPTVAVWHTPLIAASAPSATEFTVNDTAAAERAVAGGVDEDVDDQAGAAAATDVPITVTTAKAASSPLPATESGRTMPLRVFTQRA